MRHDESWLWLYLAVLVGQADGEVFIPDAALATAEKTQIMFRQDVERGGYYLSLAPAHVDGPGAGGSMGG